MRSRIRSATLVALLVAAGLAGPRHLAADPSVLAYTHVATWSSVRPDYPTRALEWPAGHQPGGVAVDLESGAMYAADRTGYTVRAYDRAGRFGAALGGPGAGPGRLRQPRDVAVLPGGNLVVSDNGNHRLQILRPDGAPVRAWPVRDPQGLAVVSDGPGATIYVVSRVDRRILVFDTAGGAVGDLPLPADGAPEGLAHDPHHAGPRRFLAADPVRGALVVVDEGGAVPREVAALPGVQAVLAPSAPPLVGQTPVSRLAGAPGLGVVPLAYTELLFPGANVPFERVMGLAIGADGALHAAVEPQGLVSLGAAGEFAARAFDSHGRLFQPRRIAVGDRAVIGDALARVGLWALDGTPAASVPATGRPPWPRQTGVWAPADVAAAADRAYVLEPGGGVHAVEGDGLGRSWAPAGPGPHGLEAIDARGERVAVLDAGAVVLLDAALDEAWRWPLPGGSAAAIVDIALAGDRVFLADAEASEVVVVSPGGAWLAAVPVAAGPVRVAAGPGNELFVLTASGWVFAYSPSGAPLGAWPAGAPDDAPVDLAVDDAGRLYVADARHVVRVYERDDAAPARLPPATGATRCGAVHDKTVAPPAIWIGEDATVTFDVDGACPGGGPNVDVALVLDVSASMGGDHKLAAVTAAAHGFVARLDPDRVRVALVSVADEARLELDLTADKAALVAALARLEAGGGSDLVAGLELGWATLAGARTGAQRVVVLVADGPWAGDDAALAAAGDRLRDGGGQVYAVGLGDAAPVESLARAAMTPGHAYASPAVGALPAILATIARRVESGVLFQAATITDLLPANMAYVPGSGMPIEPLVSPDGRTLVWGLTNLREPGFQVSYRLRPAQVGDWPANLEATLDYVDAFGGRDRVAFPVPTVRVLDPDFPTPTPPPRPPRPTASPAPLAVHLPVALREACAVYRLHVTLVVDTSSSMGWPFGAGAAGPTKIEAAREAARAFVSRIDLMRDTLGLVAFDSTARRLAAGADRATLEAALENLELGHGTRIDLGLTVAGVDQAAVAGRLGTHRAVVLLSDGMPLGGTRDAALAAAAVLHRDGVALYTVAVGEDADRPFLAEVAGAPDRAFHVTDGEELVRLYERLAAELEPCLPSWRHDD